MSTPKIRSLLRQANKLVAEGKRSASIDLFKEVLESDTQNAEAWAGLGDALPTKSERRDAYTKALEIDPDLLRAINGVRGLDGLPLKPDPNQPIPSTTATLKPPPPPTPAVATEDEAAVCYRHPDRETSLRCNRCSRPICMDCAQHTSVGYRCPECIRELEEKYYTANSSDYVIAALVAIPLSLIAGFILRLFGGGGIFLYFIIFAVGGAGGSLVARAAFYAIGRRRGRYIPQLVAAIVGVGAILPALFTVVLALIFAGQLAIFSLLLPGIYAFVASSAAYYQLR